MSRPNPSVRKLSAYNSYEALDQFLGNRDARKIANNTVADGAVRAIFENEHAEAEE